MSDAGFFDAERDRRIANLLREGIIVEVQGGKARVRLTEELITDFLPTRQVLAGRMRSWSAPVVGEQVSLLSSSGETGAGTVLRGLNCDAFDAPSGDPDVVVFAAGDDESVDQYDLAQHVRTIEIPAGGSLVIKVGDETELVITDGQILVKGAAVALGPDGTRKAVARVGDQVLVEGKIGTITQGSSAVTAS